MDEEENEIFCEGQLEDLDSKRRVLEARPKEHKWKAFLKRILKSVMSLRS
jgi:L-rhamnose mutarotase